MIDNTTDHENYSSSSPIGIAGEQLGSLVYFMRCNNSYQQLGKKNRRCEKFLSHPPTIPIILDADTVAVEWKPDTESSLRRGNRCRIQLR